MTEEILNEHFNNPNIALCNKSDGKDTDYSDHLTNLLKNEIDKQDKNVIEFTLLTKKIKKTTLEINNEMQNQNKILKDFNKDVNIP